MRKLFTLTGILLSLQVTAQNVDSYINNHSFELTNWQDISWFSLSNTGNPIIVNQTETYFSKNNITAFNGLHFAFIGGYQNASGSYEAQLAQQFYMPYDGNATLEFHMNTLNISTDPGSSIKIIVDGNAVWSIQPYYIVNSPIGYEKINVNIGFLAAGNHTFELIANENPLGGNTPMRFAFDDFVLQSISTASVNDESLTNFNVISQHGQILIQSHTNIDAEVFVQMMDLSGKIIYSNNVLFGNQFIVPANELSNGIYVVNILVNNKPFSKKVYLTK